MKADDIIEALAIAEYGNRETWPIMPEGGRDIFRQDAREVRNRLSEAGFVVLPKEELEAALRPFAEWAKRIPETAPDALVIRSTMADPGGPRGIATALNFRRAAALLAAITQETKS